MVVTHPKPGSKGIIATTVELMVPIVNLADRLGLQPLSMTASSYAIRTYQRHLSPRKGFSCAHRRWYGEISCSEYFRQAVLEHGFSKAVPLFQQRLAECHQANLSLRQLAIRAESDDAAGGSAQPRRRHHPCDHCRDCGSGDCSSLGNCDWNFGSCDRNHNGIPDSGDCGGIDLTPDCGGADVSGCDVGGCDVGGCDVGGCDVGGCDCSL